MDPRAERERQALFVQQLQEVAFTERKLFGNYPTNDTVAVKYTFERHPITGLLVWADTAVYGDELCTVYPPHEGFNGCVTIQPEAYALKSNRVMLKRFLLMYFSPLQVFTAINWCRYGSMWCFTKYRR